MDANRLHELFDKYYHDNASIEEVKELFSYLKSNDNEEINHVFQSIIDQDNSANIYFDNNKKEKILKEILGNDNMEAQTIKPIIKLNKWAKYAAAIVLFSGVALSTYFWKNNTRTISDQKQSQTVVNSGQINENSIVFTNSNGETIVLDSIGNAINLSSNIIKKEDSPDAEALYRFDDIDSKIITSNTITTPVGRQLKMLLPDGTKVWLNTKSSIKFPSQFTGNEREVEIQGEVYFDVHHDEQSPFIVKLSDETKIKVLGTQFNVHAYEYENIIETTLVEGLVSISNNESQKKLYPNQQARFNIKNNNISIATNVNTNQITSWIDGYLCRGEISLKNLAKSMEKWYGIDIILTGSDQMDLIATIPNSIKLDQLIQLLESTNKLKFSINNKKVTIMGRK